MTTDEARRLAVVMEDKLSRGLSVHSNARAACRTIRSLANQLDAAQAVVEAAEAELKILRRYIDLETKYHLHSNPQLREKHFHDAYMAATEWYAYRAQTGGKETTA